MCKSSASKHWDAGLIPRLLRLFLPCWAALRDVTLRHTRLSCLLSSRRVAIAIECPTRGRDPSRQWDLPKCYMAEPSSSSSARFSPSLSEARWAVHAALHALLHHTLFLFSFSSFTALSAETRPLICTYKDALQALPPSTTLLLHRGLCAAVPVERYKARGSVLACLPASVAYCCCRVTQSTGEAVGFRPPGCSSLPVFFPPLAD